MSYLIILSKVSQRKEGFIVLIVFDSVNARWLVFFFYSSLYCHAVACVAYPPYSVGLVCFKPCEINLFQPQHLLFWHLSLHCSLVLKLLFTHASSVEISICILAVGDSCSLITAVAVSVDDAANSECSNSVFVSPVVNCKPKGLSRTIPSRSGLTSNTLLSIMGQVVVSMLVAIVGSFCKVSVMSMGYFFTS